MTSVAIGKMTSGLLARALVPMQGNVDNCDSWLCVELLSSSKQESYMCCQTLHGHCSSQILFVIAFTWRSNSTISSNSGSLRFPNGAHKLVIYVFFQHIFDRHEKMTGTFFAEETGIIANFCKITDKMSVNPGQSMSFGKGTGSILCLFSKP